jgi:hypothetical protein
MVLFRLFIGEANDISGIILMNDVRPRDLGKAEL